MSTASLNGLIEHATSRQLIDAHFREVGALGVYDIHIDKDQLYSAWTPIKDQARAYQVETGSQPLYLYVDEWDNYARMVAVPEQAVTAKTFVKDITDPEKLPAVGHIYRQEREQAERQEARKAQRERERAQASVEVRSNAQQSWALMESMNDKYGHIFDLSMGREAFVESRLAHLNQWPSSATLGTWEDQAAHALNERLSRFEAAQGHPFVASLPEDGTSRERYSELIRQLQKAEFLAENGYFPRAESVDDVDENDDLQVSWRLTLEDRDGHPLAEATFILEDSERYYGCLGELTLVRLEDTVNGVTLTDEEVLYNESALGMALGSYAARRFEGYHFDLEDGAITHRVPSLREIEGHNILKLAVLDDQRSLLGTLNGNRALRDAVEDIKRQPEFPPDTAFSP